MERAQAYPITYGVLGLLAFWGPMSGYDIKRLFDHVLTPMWGAVHSQIYNELRRMKELGWVEMEREEQEARPDRKVYTMTPAGREALTAWQAQEASAPQLRDELLLKILFGRFGRQDDLIENIEKGIIEHEQRLLTYRQLSNYLPTGAERPSSDKRPNPYATTNEEDPYFALITRFAIDLENTYLRWLHETRKFLEEQETSPHE